MAAISADRKDHPPFEATITEADGGYLVTAADGKTEKFVFGAYGKDQHQGSDLWKFPAGNTTFTTSGLHKLRSLGLCSAHAYPSVQGFLAAAAPAAAPVAPASLGSQSSDPQAPPALANQPEAAHSAAATAEPDFAARMRERHGLPAASPSASNASFADRMRARHAPPPEEGRAVDPIAPSQSSNTEPDFLARMKHRHGVT